MKFVTVRHPEAGEATVPESALGQLASQGWTEVEPEPENVAGPPATKAKTQPKGEK